MIAGRLIAARGTVQGVGFRPWVYRLARRHGIAGRVWNDVEGVAIEAFGSAEALDAFLEALRSGAPEPAHVEAVSWAPIPAAPAEGFIIDDSAPGGQRSISIPADLATCPACLAELRDHNDRRFGYPFLNCTHCGPRFTIATDLPYDRPATTMAGFVMCEACRREYERPEDRRFHAQPNACPVCGPRLTLENAAGEVLAVRDPVEAAASLLRSGKILAVKGIGGYHLACDATSELTVARLRERKGREAKPLAVMVLDLPAARRLALLDHDEERLLTGPERSIVLCRRRRETPLSAGISPDTPLVGLILPYAPLHYLLLAATGRPLVMTSGNRSDEPIAKDDDDARARLAGIADYLLLHDRPIATRCDDSVARVIAGGPTLLRRSRGWVPRSIRLRRPVARPILACGALLKNTFCLASGDAAVLGPHVGDLDDARALDFFEEAVERMQRLLDVTPEIVAHDLHPDYPSTRWALARAGLRQVAVQHHHAHVASAMAEHGLEGQAIGLAWDGSGYGSDGTAWGGELLVAGYADFERLATFRPVRLAGGDQAVRQPWRIALALLEDAFEGDGPFARLELFSRLAPADVRVVRQMLARGLNAPPAHGVGRLFDGIGALVLGRPRSAFEGQIATAWNLAADAGERGVYPFLLEDGVVDTRPLVRAVVGELLARTSPGIISARFHQTLAAIGLALVRHAEARRGALPVVLSGGCFQNALLVETLVRDLAPRRVLLHRNVPPGDGGIALGQAVVADAVCEGRN